MQERGQRTCFFHRSRTSDSSWLRDPHSKEGAESLYKVLSLVLDSIDIPFFSVMRNTRENKQQVDYNLKARAEATEQGLIPSVK
jgi:hypothetical protein